MTKHPIIFSGTSIPALLDGRKTQTRRIVKLPNPTRHVVVDPGGTIFGPGPYIKAYRNTDMSPPEDGNIAAMHPRVHCPYGYPGDRLWVKEAYAAHELYEALKPSEIPAEGRVWSRLWFAARDSGCEDGPDHSDAGRWRNCLFMPLWASRITLEVTDVRVERVQGISEEDAIAEGVDAVSMAAMPRQGTWTRRQDFAQIWNKLNGKKPGCSWDDNPWVWVIEFRRIEPNKEGHA